MPQPVNPVGQDLNNKAVPLVRPADNQGITVPGTGKGVKTPGVSFKDILKQQRTASSQTVSQTTETQGAIPSSVSTEPLRFSAHAQARMKLRNISLSPEEINKLAQVVDKVAAKGAKESLVLMNDLALVVSVKNRTVITAVDGANLKENVFTNIDSAVIV